MVGFEPTSSLAPKASGVTGLPNISNKKEQKKTPNFLWFRVCMIYYIIIYQLSTNEPTNVQNIPRYQQLLCGFELMTLCILIVFIVFLIIITNISKVSY